MAAPANNDEFLELIRKSGVADERRLDAWLQKAKSNGSLPAKPIETAALLVRDSILTNFQAQQILQGKWRRFTIGKYKVLESLGSGGMGSVYLCEHKLMRRRVAVKVLPAAKAQDQSALERFYREARAVAALDHPNIVHAYDIDRDESLHFLVMEFVDGASLQEIVKKSGPMDISRACHYMRQATMGLEHAHESGLIHRDIKPGNILVDRAGVVKILDLGLARFFNDEDDVLTKKFDENVLGTADYLAPEQAIDSHSVDIRADIYSLGATFYFMLTGRTPFGEGTVAQKLLWHQNRQPKPVTEFRSEVPTELAAVISKMMAKERGLRYQTPAEVAQALEPFAQEAIAPPPDQEMPHLSPAAAGPVEAEQQVDTAIVKTVAATPPKALQGMSSKQKASPAAPRAPGTPPTSPKSAPAAPAPRLGGGPASPSAPKPKVATSAAAKTAPSRTSQALVQSGPESTSAEGESPWVGLSSVDTEDPSAKADTAPLSSHSARSLSRLSVVKNPKRAWLIFGLIGGGAGMVIVGLIIYFVMAASRAGSVGGPSKILDVTRTASSGASGYRTVMDALRAAQPGDTIQLHDPEHFENLHIELPRMRGEIVSDVTIRVAAGKEVIWRPLRKEEDVPILHLQNAQSLKIEGRGLTFDGALDANKRLKNLIVVNFTSPGLTLDGATLKGFSRSGVNIVNVFGSKDRPVRLANLIVIGAAPEAEAGLLFDANPDVQPPFSDHFVLADLHLHGVKEGIKKVDNTVVGKNIKWPR